MTQENNKETVTPKEKDIQSNLNVSSEPDVIGKLRKMGFKFGTVVRHSWKPEDRNLI